MGTKPELTHLDGVSWESFGGQTEDIFRKSLSPRAFPLLITLNIFEKGVEK